jgi:ribosomal protein S8
MNQFRCFRILQSILIYFLVVSLADLISPLGTVHAVTTGSGAPILRHTFPPTPLLGGTLLIAAVVEGENGIVAVNLWYRAAGKREYNKVSMIKDAGETYNARIQITKDLKKGIEYYIVAADESGNEGMDGTQMTPYFLKVRDPAQIAELSNREEQQSAKRPWWKSRWFWAGVILAVGGGVAAASVNRKDEGQGTVIVQ